MQTAASSSGHVDVSISLGGGFGTRRRQRRGFAVLPLTIRANGSEHVGLLRDISPSGLFFYSDAKPAVGSRVQVVINASSADPDVKVTCVCRVVRVQPHLAGAATGIAAKIERYEGR